jgi:GNAT superfamily N-acetyltransferase
VHAWLAWEVAAGRDDVPRGFVTLVAAGGPAGLRHAIGWLVVDPAARRRGIGRALVAVAVGEARRQGAAAVWVETAAAWPEAAAFWRELGFEPGSVMLAR